MDYILMRNREGYEELPIQEKDNTEGRIPYKWSGGGEQDTMYLPETGRRFCRRTEILLDTNGGDICFPESPFRILFDQDRVLVQRIREGIPFFRNGKELEVEGEISIAVQPGDCILNGGMQIRIHEEDLVLTADRNEYHTSLPEQAVVEKPFEGFPIYKRSPRLIKNIPAEPMEINSPPEKSKMSKGSIIQVVAVPLLMLAVTVTVSILMKRGMFVLMSLVSSVMGITVSVTKFVNDRKEQKEKEIKRQEHYENYLLDVRKKLNRAKEEEKEALAYNYPDTGRIAAMVSGYSNRIYERGGNDGDFLTVNIGYVRDCVSYPIKFSYDEQKLERDELELEAKKILDEFSGLEHKPLVLDLKKAHLGLVGEKEVIHNQLKILTAQMAFFHSYHDLQIINIYSSKYSEVFEWQKWYPHLKIRAVNTYGNICTEKMRDQVLGSMTQILKERKQKAEESKKEARFRPHFLFVIDEPKLIMDHAIMEYLDKEGDNLGFSIIYTSHLRANLPENIGSVLMLENSSQATLLLNEKQTVNRKLQLADAGSIDFERMARDLGVLVHEQGIVSHIPESITFLGMYQVESPKQLKVEERWKKNESHKTLAVPLGLRASDDILYLDLHEKAHGPHGLVAGTTGSGKSEIVQSYILSLAVNFHPYEVGFLLIDYKGGGMAGLFKELPHLLGTITNLDGSESMRAMASIKSELSRRQRIFSENEVNHINAYNKLFKTGKVKEPIPHLFLISDEFAELKKEQPDFMAELVSAARIGRSLGIHLILATQKPSGVVDDQIWTNSRFKLALKVQNEGDSKEILKTPDAAFITQAGRAYLQVGNNEIYELFQSAWSGASYSEDREEEEVDDRVYLINELGQGQLVNGDLSAGTDSSQSRATQLDVVVRHVREVYESREAMPVKKPWLPSLPVKIVSPLAPAKEVVPENREEQEMPCCLRVPLGMVDIPEEQKQSVYELDLMKDGNIAFFGAAGYGKSLFLTNVILSLVLQNSVDNLNLYLCDFGNSALISLNGLPHTSDYIVLDDTERLGKLMGILTEEIKIRKKLFAQEMVQNFDVYNQSSSVTMKAIIVVVDNYDIVKDLGFELEEFFTKLSRDGMSLGIYMVITATRYSAVKFSAINNYKNKIAGYLFDTSEYNTIVGKSAYKLPEIPGRAYVKLSSVNIMQIYTMLSFESEVEYNAALKHLVSQITAMFPNKRAPRIPVLPEQFDHTMFTDYQRDENTKIVLGLHRQNVCLRGISKGMTPFAIVGEGGKGKTNMLHVILSQIREQTWIFDSKSRELYYCDDWEYVSYVDGDEDIEDFLDSLSEECSRRKTRLEEAQRENRMISQRDFYMSLRPCYIIIDDMDEFVEKYKNSGKEMLEGLKEAGDTGIMIIVTIHSAKPKGFDDLTKWFKSAVNGLAVGSQGTLNMFPVISVKDQPGMGEGLLYTGAYEKLLLPLYRR